MNGTTTITTNQLMKVMNLQEIMEKNTIEGNEIGFCFGLIAMMHCILIGYA
jgi:hypothetical protein